jgi:hypothetical protein
MTRPLSIAATLLVLSGCTPATPPQDAGDPGRGYVRVALTFTRDGGGVRFDAQGHFVRVHQLQGERVAAALGMADNDSIPLDTCRVVDGAGEIDRALQTASTDAVELLDAGRLLVKGPLDATMLQPRRYPELTPYVAGVMYGAADSYALQLEPGALYEVAAEGGDEVGAFMTQGSAPRAFPSLEVLPYHRGGDLELKWGDAGEVAEPLTISLAWSSRSGAREVRCRVRDDGNYRIGRELLPSENVEPQSAELTVLRVRRTPLSAPGAGRGELSIGLREVVPLVTDER